MSNCKSIFGNDVSIEKKVSFILADPKHYMINLHRIRRKLTQEEKELFDKELSKQKKRSQSQSKDMIIDKNTSIERKVYYVLRDFINYRSNMNRIQTELSKEELELFNKELARQRMILQYNSR